MKLDQIYQELIRNARRTGRDRIAELAGGARIAARFRDGQITVTVSRDQKPLGTTELVTFARIIAPPATATRIPAEGQGIRDTRRYVAWRWSDPEATDGQ